MIDTRPAADAEVADPARTGAVSAKAASIRTFLLNIETFLLG
jgi:hypothetical protein